ncbi:hypothetical protein FRX31_016567 [Thalictrum thalictroides]|uniref:MBD domain-containing protein n=1 Tax=Thalictrum thalictroides TaxID=46969 RepID=A0A7J6WA69_THATH|nr:hypothetical protein FRX31_016567 [Thalictrum thalictroides]
MSDINTYYSTDSDSEITPADPQVAAMAASPRNNNLVEVEVTGPTGILPPYTQIEIPVYFMEPPQASSSSSTPPVTKQKRKHNGEWKVVPDRSTLKKNTDWVPLDWTIRTKDRLNGNTAGRKDHEFVAPNGLRFRSKKEVDAYREHGILPKTIRNLTLNLIFIVGSFGSGMPSALTTSSKLGLMTELIVTVRVRPSSVVNYTV